MTHRKEFSWWGLVKKLLWLDWCTGEQNSPFYTFFPPFCKQNMVALWGFSNVLFFRMGKGMLACSLGKYLQIGVFSPFSFFFKRCTTGNPLGLPKYCIFQVAVWGHSVSITKWRNNLQFGEQRTHTGLYYCHMNELSCPRQLCMLLY
jgi:hypothetical protein